MSYIEIKNLYFTYDKNCNENYVLKNITLNIKKGESLALIGQNGSGKTTLVKQLNGLVKPSGGSIYIDGENIKNYSTAQLSAKLGFVFQNPDEQIFHRTVYDEIAFGPRNFGFSNNEIEKRIKDISYFLKIEDILNLNPYDLHPGKRKLVAVASTLVVDTEVIILDEPTIGQSLEGKKLLSKMLFHLSKKGKTIITITHDMDFTINNFSRVVVLNDGIIAADGGIREIFWNQEVLSKAGVKAPCIINLAEKIGMRENIINIKEFISYIENKLYNQK